MYELNGKTWTVDDIQSAADRNNLSYDEALEQLTGAGMTELDLGATKAMNTEEFQQAYMGSRGSLPGGPNQLEKLALGTLAFTETFENFFALGDNTVFSMDVQMREQELGRDLTGDEKIDLYKRYEETGVTGVLGKASSFLENYVTREDGTITNLLKKSYEEKSPEALKEAANKTVDGMIQSLPSLVAARFGPWGLAVLGASVAGGKFKEELYADPDENLGLLYANSIVSGGIEAGFESVTRGLMKRAGLIKGKYGAETAKQFFKESMFGFAKRLGVSFAAEGASESLTEATSMAFDALPTQFGGLGREVDFDKAIERITDAFIIGGAIGPTITSAGKVNAIVNPKARERAYNTLMSGEDKGLLAGIAQEANELGLAVDKADAASREIIEKRLSQLNSMANRIKGNNKTAIDEMTKEEIGEYASLVDAQTALKKRYSKAKSEKEKSLIIDEFNQLSKEADVIRSNANERLGQTYLTNVQEYANDIGAQIEVISDPESFQKRYEELSGEKTNVRDGDGVFESGVMLINEKVAKEKGAISVANHEFLHNIIGRSYDKLSPEQKRNLNKSFFNILNKDQQDAVKNRLSESYGITGEAIFESEEMFTAFSDAIDKKEISFNESLFNKAGNITEEVLRIFGKRGEFENGRQVYNFLRNYHKTIKKGKRSKRITEFAKVDKITPGEVTPEQVVKESRTYKKTDRDVRIDKLGEQYTKEEYGSAKDNKPGKGTDVYFELYASGDLEAMVRGRITDEMKRTPGFLEEDFVNETIIQLKKHIENFDVSKKKTEEGFGLSGWIRSQVGNKIGDVLKKGVVTEEKFTSDIQESTEAQVVAAEEADLEVFEMENLSPEAQLAKNKEKQERQSKLRRKLGFETGGEMYNKVLNSAKKSVLIAYRKTQSIKDPAQRAKAIKDLLRKEYFTSGLTSDLFKSTKNFLGKKDYIKNLKQYREAIIESLSTADLVQMERNIPDTDRVFTFFVEKLTKIEDVESAVRNGLLPTEAINAIRKGQAVNLYRKRMPTEMELVSFADQPAINPTTGQRSGLKGTRKDGFAKAIANTMVLDAVMEVRQSEDVVEALEDDAIAQLDLMALSDAVGREVDVKFSKSTAVVDINNAIDNNINLAVYSQIKFSRSHREAYEARLTKKRTDLDEKQIKGAVESIFKFVESDNIPNNKKAKYEKMAMHYMANGYLILPEDGYKVIEAERIATIKKIDPFSYKNPNELIERFVGEVKGARTNPDTVKEFTNKTDVGSGVIVYDVADSKEGQLAVRKVIDTHFGKKANPWCLAARRGTYLYTDEAFDKAEKDAIVEREEAKGYNVVVYEMANYMEGILYEGKPGQTIEAYEIVVSEKADPKNELKESFKNWKSYNKEGNGYKIAFKDGKLLCFRDGNKKQWWDRNDKPSDKIHFVVTEKKGDVESTFTVVPEDGTKTLTKKIKGKMPNAEVFYVRDDNNYNIKSTTTYVGGAITKQRIETTYKDSRLAGTIFLEKEMGQSSDIQLNNMTKDVEVKDGDILTRELKGKVVLTSKQFKQFEDKAVEIEQVTNIQTSETISLTINGVKQDIGVKFSKSVAEVNYNKALNSIKFSRKKQDPYIADQLNIARELGNTSDEIIYARLEQELKNGTPLQEAHAVAFKEAYGDQAAEIIQQDGNSVKDLQQNINKFYLPKVRAFAKDVALKKYAKLIKATKDTEAQQDLINSFLINYGRPIRSGKVLNITTNRALLVEMEKAFGEEAMRPYELVPVESGEKVMVNGEDIDLYKSITPIKADPAKYTDKVNEQAGFAKKFLFEDVLQDDNLSNGEKKALVQLMFYGQKGPGRKLYKLGVYVEGMPVSKTTLEHEITANDMHNAIIDVIDGKMDIDELRDTIDNAYVHVLPKEINDVFKKLGKTSKRNLQGYNSMPEVLEYLQTLNLKGNTGLFDFSNNEAISRKGSAIKPSRSVNKLTKGITVLDFDDTLATSKSLVKFTRPDGTKGTLTPEQYAATYEDLLDLGYKFDFSEFSKVVDGKPAPLLNKAKKLAGKFGTENMFILTARPADSAPAIKEFLKQNGLDIPLKNITGLGNSTAEAKALWMADKVADGYNDFYFADDALKNVQAVKNVLDQFDVKSKIQQARVKFSKSLSPELNKMIERNKGFKAEQVFDEATAKQLGKDKGKYEFFISAGADDFQGLMMRLAGKGEQGNRDMQFFKETLFDPFNKAYREMNEYAYVMLNDLDALIKEYPDVRKRFKQPLEGTDFDTDQAIRIYLWHKNGQDIPGLSDKQAANISSKVASDSRLVEFATKLNKIPKLRGEYTKPGENWTVENIKADIYNAVENSRAEFLLEWQENADALFAQENLNKLEAVYGSDYVDALKNILHRMKTGRNRVAGKDKEANKLLNWINNSVGAIMFFNSRSAVLQTLSIVNFIDYENNNIFAAGKAFANQKQYWEDFSFLFNSPTLKMRRAGVQTDVSASDIAEAVKGKRNPAKAAIAYLLTVGFTPTQIADSFAISAGGATYYRNQVNFYVKEGMSRPKAEEKAFADFQSKTEEAQQSSRPDRISRQQASVLGRLILAFQNTPMQYNRIIKKSVLDIVNGRGDLKSNISKILYYGTAQGLIFNALQNAIFALNFDDDEEEMTDKELKKAQKFKEKKYNRILDGMISSLLRGSGLKGAYIDTVYKTVKEFQTQRAKGWKADHAETFITALNVSPPIGSKFRKLYSAIKSDKFNKDIYDHMSYGDINHPIYDVATSAIEAVTNAPTQRMHRKIININDAFRDHLSVWQRAFLLGGWNRWSLGIEEGEEKKEAIEAAKQEKKETIKKRKPKKDEKRCSAIKSDGKRCKNITTNESGRCYAHD